MIVIAIDRVGAVARRHIQEDARESQTQAAPESTRYTGQEHAGSAQPVASAMARPDGGVPDAVLRMCAAWTFGPENNADCPGHRDADCRGHRGADRHTQQTAAIAGRQHSKTETDPTDLDLRLHHRGCRVRTDLRSDECSNDLQWGDSHLSGHTQAGFRSGHVDHLPAQGPERLLPLDFPVQVGDSDPGAEPSDSWDVAFQRHLQEPQCSHRGVEDVHGPVKTESERNQRAIETPPISALPDDLVATLRQFLELEVRRLQRAEDSLAGQARHDTVMHDIGRMLNWAFLLAVYAFAVAILSQRALLDALLVPAELPGLIAQRITSSIDLYSSIPDSIRGLLLPLVTSALLLMFRASPMRLRVNLSGLLFAALISLALLGLSAGVVTPPWGSAASIPGFVACTAILYFFAQTLIKIDALEHRDQSPQIESDFRLIENVARKWRSFQLRIDPRGSRWKTAVFVVLPVLSAAIFALDYLIATDLTQEDPLKAAGQLVFLVWLGWGMTATPAAARIALWGPAAWTLWIGWIVKLYPVGPIFVASTLLVLIIDVALVVLRQPPHPPSDRERAC